jgi:hypothetical protein
MKKIYLCILAILPVITFAQSPCDNESAHLTSQAEVDAFPSTFCSSICHITIHGDDITNLDSLYVLNKVGFMEIIFNPMLTDISGLRNVTSFEEECWMASLTIDGNNLLPDLDGLSGLTKIEGYISITRNTMLSDISGLSNLTEVESVTIADNASLDNLNGLQGLTRINGGLSISGNPALADINGLSNVTRIDGFLSISNCDAITSLAPLSSLTYVRDQLTLQGNPMLASITGLSNLTHIGQFSASGESLTVNYNDVLVSLEGLQGLDTIPGVLTIEGNASLQDLNALSSVQTLDAPAGSSYNSGIRVANNNSLNDISGINAIDRISGGRQGWLEFEGNPALTSLGNLSITEVYGGLLGKIRIVNNASLANLDGLSALTTVSGGMSAGMTIDNNPALQNIDGLSNLGIVSSAGGGSMTITNNTTLGRFCGLYKLIHERGINCGGPYCYTPDRIVISGNERNPTPEQIEEEGPCNAVVEQPTNLVFSNVTSEGMRGKFTRSASFASGYVVLMQAYGYSAPENVPQDGTTYHVGQVIGSSSIVVSVGSDTTFVVSGLVPSTPYYFDVFAYRVTENGNDYLTVNPLEGSQSTTAQTQSAGTLTFTDVNDDSMTVMLDAPEEGDYIALMKAFGYPSPNDAPVDGTQYHVGNTIGSSTIVVNIGDGSAFTVNGLEPNVTYYFDVYRFDASTLVYESTPAQGNQKTNESGENLRAYPNPFDVSTTIPFVVSGKEQAVKVAIYDAMGVEVNVLTSGSYGTGKHEASWDGYDKDGRKMTAGVYIYNIKTERGVIMGRVSLR